MVEVIRLNRAIHTIRVLCVILAILSAALFVYVRMDYLAKTQLEGPEISMDSDSVTVSIHDDTSAILAGVTATDAGGRDISDQLLVENLGSFTAPATREAVIAVFDQAGNVTKARRTVVYRDYTEPKLSLSGPLSSTSTASSTLLDRVTVTDCLDGDISDQVILSPADQGILPSVGEFAAVLQVSNSAGGTLEVPLTVEFYNAAEARTRPEIELSDYLIYVHAGSTVTPASYLKNLTLDGNEYYYDRPHQTFVRKGNTYQQAIDSLETGLVIPLSKLQINDPARYDAPGVYEIVYRCTGATGVTGTVRLVVIVQEAGG